MEGTREMFVVGKDVWKDSSDKHQLDLVNDLAFCGPNLFNCLALS